MKSKITYLVFIQDTFYFQSFKKDLLSVSKQIIVITPTLDIKIVYAPKNSKLLNKTWFFYNKESFIFNKQFIYIPIFIFQLIKIFTYLVKNFDINKVIVDNVYAAVIIGVLHKLNFFKKTFYLGNDWLYDKNKTNLLSKLSCNIIFPVADYFACKLNSVTFSNKYIFKERLNFWHKKVWSEGRTFNYWKTQITSLSEKRTGLKKNSMLFIGVTREDSGFKLILDSLKELNKSKDKYYFKIIGPLNKPLKDCLEYAKEIDVFKYIKYLGFLPTSQFAKNAEDCFCGLNLITNTQSYTMFTTPSKVIYYLEFLLPPLITKGNGYLVTNLIKQYNLGKITQNKQTEIVKDINQLKEKNSFYVNKIKNFIKSNKKVDFEAIFY